MLSPKHLTSLADKPQKSPWSFSGRKYSHTYSPEQSALCRTVSQYTSGIYSATAVFLVYTATATAACTLIDHPQASFF
jgi:hypothetical protein